MLRVGTAWVFEPPPPHPPKFWPRESTPRAPILSYGEPREPLPPHGPISLLRPQVALGRSPGALKPWIVPMFRKPKLSPTPWRGSVETRKLNPPKPQAPSLNFKRSLHSTRILLRIVSLVCSRLVVVYWIVLDSLIPCVLESPCSTWAASRREALRSWLWQFSLGFRVNIALQPPAATSTDSCREQCFDLPCRKPIEPRDAPSKNPRTLRPEPES